jgi:hypothetical protein
MFDIQARDWDESTAAARLGLANRPEKRGDQQSANVFADVNCSQGRRFVHEMAAVRRLPEITAFARIFG